MLGSLLAMPIIVLNMGGEMIYILHQRLQAQNVPDEKSRKVLEDVVRTMYTTVFLDELFKPQEMYTATSTKQIFEKLAHSSIMRLNKTSMDKLYDLMTMGVKYQLISCKSPQQYLQVTLNHLDSLIDMVKSDFVTQLIQTAISKSIEMYSSLSNGNWLLLQQTLFQFYQGKKIKVSLFLQQNLQGVNGVLVLNNSGNLPFGTELPGQIRYYENEKVVRSDAFHSDLVDKCFECSEVLESGSRLGMNMYTRSAATDVSASSAQSKSEPTMSVQEATKAFARTTINAAASPKTTSSPPKATKYSQFSAKAELTMLSDLLGLGAGNKGEKASVADNKPFKINLFSNHGFNAKGGDDEEEEYKGGGDDGANGFITIDIDARADAKTVTSYMRDLDLGGEDSKAAAKRDEDEEDDLLALMDSAK